MALGLAQRIRGYAQEARQEAKLASDALVKARLHEIANELERLAEEIERLPSRDRSS
jgi:hypothetical protein